MISSSARRHLTSYMRGRAITRNLFAKCSPTYLSELAPVVSSSSHTVKPASLMYLPERKFHKNFSAMNEDKKKAFMASLKELRQITEAPMGQCRKALEESNGDIELAREWLKKKGIQMASKKSERNASSGLVSSRIAPDRSFGILFEINNETDFVTMNEKFASFVNNICNATFKQYGETKNVQMDVKEVKMEDGRTIENAVTDMVAQVGENIVIRRWKAVNAEEGAKVYSYVHNANDFMGGSIATLVSVRPIKVNMSESDLEEYASQIAMHITAINPQYYSSMDVPKEMIENEKKILREKAISEGAKQEHLDKIINGQTNKFLKSIVFLEQPWVMDGKTPVKKILDTMQVRVDQFVRFKVGE